ncbi:MAG: hypothetical protein ACI9W2_001040 [Gammaproteobacteria bacterium]|jgi:hypothetical protein
MPRQIISANNDTIFSVKPNANIKATVAAMATGIPGATQNAAHEDKNKNNS